MLQPYLAPAANIVSAAANLPVWIRMTAGALAGLTLLAGLACFRIPNVLFGSAGYSIEARLAIGLLATALIAFAAATVSALRARKADALLPVFSGHAVLHTLAPPVMLYNIGAMDRWYQTAGLNPVALALAYILLIGVPTVLGLIALKKLVRA